MTFDQLKALLVEGINQGARCRPWSADSSTEEGTPVVVIRSTIHRTANACLLAVGMALIIPEPRAAEAAPSDPFLDSVCSPSDPAGPVSDWDTYFTCVVSVGSPSTAPGASYGLVERILALRRSEIPRGVQLYWRARVARFRQDDARYRSLLDEAAGAGHGHAAYELFTLTGDPALLEAALSRGNARAMESRIDGLFADGSSQKVAEGVRLLEAIASDGNVQAIQQLSAYADRLPEERRPFWNVVFTINEVSDGAPHDVPAPDDWGSICSLARQHPRALAAAPPFTTMGEEARAMTIEYIVHCGAPSRE